MVEEGAVAVFAPGKGADVFDNAAEEEEGEGEDCAHLDYDGVHLPVGVIEGDVHESFRDAQMRRRADREKLGQAFHNAQKDGLKIGVQKASVAPLARRLKSGGGRGKGRKTGLKSNCAMLAQVSVHFLTMTAIWLEPVSYTIRLGLRRA